MPRRFSARFGHTRHRLQAPGRADRAPDGGASIPITGSATPITDLRPRLFASAEKELSLRCKPNAKRHARENPPHRIGRRIQRPARHRDVPPAGERHRHVAGKSGPPPAPDLRFLHHISQGGEVRRAALRPPALRLSGGDARLPGSGPGHRHRGQRREVPAQGLGAGLPSGPHPRHVARPQHEGIHLLLIRGQRGAPPLGARTRAGHRLAAENPP